MGRNSSFQLCSPRRTDGDHSETQPQPAVLNADTEYATRNLRYYIWVVPSQLVRLTPLLPVLRI